MYNGSNVVSAASMFGWTQPSCFGHNFTVSNATKDDARISRAMGVCKRIVISFLHSWKKKEWANKVSGGKGFSRALTSQRLLYAIGLAAKDGDSNSRAPCSHSPSAKWRQEDLPPDSYLARYNGARVNQFYPCSSSGFYWLLSGEEYVSISLVIKPLLKHLQDLLLDKEDKSDLTRTHQ